MAQQLGHKEQNLFRQLGRLYDAKQYKKALKTSEQILRKSPDHADTLAMKALTLNQLGQSEEAFALGKVALQKNMKSHICWHVYGLLYRHVKNFDEAVKAYKFALRLEPEAATILRDLAFLQVQIRDYQGYIQSRKTILQARPQLRQNWTALAVAYHLAGDLHMAEEMLKTYEGTLKQSPPRSDIEHSEAVLYKNTIIAEAGDTERALQHLDGIYKSNLDRTAVMELRAQYLLQLGRREEAEKAYRDLLERNNEYRLYYEKLEEVLELDRSKQDDHQKLKELYASYSEKGNVRVDAPLRIPLDFLHGDDFRTAADSYLQRMLRKGVPSTFPNIKALYADEFKKRTIQGSVEGYAAGNFSEEQTEANGTKGNRFEQSVYYFLAQHYDYHLSRDLDKATKYIEKAIALSPESVDYNQTKGRISKHQGDIEKAAEQMDHARRLDEKDRYINTKCAKYQLRNNQHQTAIETMSKFTRNQTVADALGDLHDMQCMWYLFEDGQAYARQGDYGLALKRYKSIYDIFDLWQEDQFDFHHFSIRKGQIRAYVDMIRWEDRLREHSFYTRAAIAAIKIYLTLHDKPDSAHGPLANGIAMDKMDANEKKKALKKAKREQEKRDKEEAEKREAEKKAAKKASSTDGETKKVDSDPNGTKLVQTETPLDDAVKFLAPLLEFSPKDIRAQNVGFEVFIRRRKYLLALKCLKAAASIDSEDPVLHEQIIRFRLALDSDSTDLPPPVVEVLKSNSNIIPEKSKLASYNDSFVSKHSDSARHVRCGLTARRLLDPKSQTQIEKDLVTSFQLESSGLQDAKEGLELLHEWGSDAAVVESCREAGAKRWPQASLLRSTGAKTKN